MVRYVLCLVCGRLTPDDKGVCYHCGAPLPRARLVLGRGEVVCPSCLRVTPVRFGRCVHCGAPLKGVEGLVPWLSVDVESDGRVAGYEFRVGG